LVLRLTRASIVLFVLLALASAAYASEYFSMFEYQIAGTCINQPVVVTVTDAATSQPVRAQVRFQTIDPVNGYLSEVYFNWTDQYTGIATYTPAVVGVYRISITRPGYRPADYEWNVSYCPQCVNNSMCNRTSICVDFLCVPVTGECGRVVEQAWVPYECCDDSACASNQVCMNTYCTNLTGRCGRAENHTWYNYDCCVGADCASGMECVDHACVATAQCASDVDCMDNQRCASGDCVLITGECGTASNHRWIQWQCCADDQCLVNERCADNHACEPFQQPTPQPPATACPLGYAAFGAALLAIAIKR